MHFCVLYLRIRRKELKISLPSAVNVLLDLPFILSFTMIRYYSRRHTKVTKVRYREKGKIV